MSSYKFKVGQMVDFVPSKRGVGASARAYKILRLVPHEVGERCYRIKTIAEAFERIVKESELRHTSTL